MGFDLMEPIEVGFCSGAAAVREAADIYKRFKRRMNQPPRATDRTPGWIALPPSARSHALAMLVDLNRVKAELLTAVGALPRYRSKAEGPLAGTELEHVMLSQACRSIVWIDAPVDRISFGWNKRDRVVQRVNKAELMQRLEDSAGDGATRWIRALASAPGDWVAIAREKRPVPNVNIWVEETLIPRRHVAMPIVLLQGPPTESNPLRSYEPPGLLRPRRPPNPGKQALSEEPIIKELHVYAYR